MATQHTLIDRFDCLRKPLPGRERAVLGTHSSRYTPPIRPPDDSSAHYHLPISSVCTHAYVHTYQRYAGAQMSFKRTK